ncbi:unnamed protein product [Brassica napus]|uniref:(rape) hypothetical protein n=1 Tax=Brassica napus TaxID=3708 RepID=A0A816M7Z3_BRANA|nr:unnamed protein product [Brassica napus]
MDERIDGIEKEMKKLKETEKENNEGFDYQGMDFDWDMTYGTERKKPVDTKMVEDTEVVEEPEGRAGNRSSAEAGEDVGKEGEEDVPEKEEHKKYTEEEKQGWILSIYKSNDGIPDVDKMDGTERSHAHSSVKHMPKVMAVNKHGPKKRVD